MSWLLLCAAHFAVSPAVVALGCAATRHRLRTARFYGRWAVIAGSEVLFSLPFRSWEWTAGDALSFVVALILWWLSRRKRKRAAKMLGAKARALRGKLVKTMPRWSPRLMPQRIPA